MRITEVEALYLRLPEIQARYPGGTTVYATRDGKFEFVAYELPAQE